MATGTFTFRYIEADIPPAVTITEYRHRRAAEHRPAPIKRLRRYMRDFLHLPTPDDALTGAGEPFAS